MYICYGMPLAVRGPLGELVLALVEHRLSGLAAVSLPTELARWPTKLINTPDIFWANFPVSL